MKSNLYTRTGDDGTTSLVDGSRTPKDDLRVDTYGDIDELSSVLGLLASSKDCPDEIGGQIQEIQHTLFNVGTYLATPVSGGERPEVPGIIDETNKIEGWIDTLDEQTPKIRSFILPGGSEESSRCHVARTVCRRAERKAIALARQSYVDPALLGYLNRLSDYLFIAARYLNFIRGIDEIVWKP